MGEEMTNTNALTTAIINYVTMIGGCAIRINVVPPPIRVGGKVVGFRKSTMTGVEDIICIINGRYVGIEVKVAKDKQSAEQIVRMEKVVRAGGYYLIAKDFDSTKFMIDEIRREDLQILTKQDKIENKLGL